MFINQYKPSFSALCVYCSCMKLNVWKNSKEKVFAVRNTEEQVICEDISPTFVSLSYSLFLFCPH